jgi:Peptidase family M23
MAAHDAVMQILLPPRSGETPRLTSGWVRDNGTRHGAWDFSYSQGQSGLISQSPLFYSPINGVVTRADTRDKVQERALGASGMIEVTDVFGIRHQFLHGSASSVNVGDFVQIGSPLGTVGKEATKDFHVHYQIRPPGLGADPLINPDTFYGSRTPESYGILDARDAQAPSSVQPVLDARDALAARRVLNAIADEIPINGLDLVSPQGDVKIHADEFIDGETGAHYLSTQIECNGSINFGLVEITLDRYGNPSRSGLRLYDGSTLARDVGTYNAQWDSKEDHANRLYVQLMATFGYVVNSQGSLIYQPSRYMQNSEGEFGLADDEGFSEEVSVGFDQNVSDSNMGQQIENRYSSLTSQSNVNDRFANNNSIAEPTDTEFESSMDFVSPWQVMQAISGVGSQVRSGAAPEIVSQPVLGQNDLLIASLSTVTKSNPNLYSYRSSNETSKAFASIA